MPKKKLFITLAVIGLVFILLVFKRASFKVETFKVTKGKIVETISSSGKIDADQKADLTFQTGGRVSWVGVKKGDKVRKWQGIASLDTVVLNAAYQQALNTYRSLEAAAQKAEDEVKNHASDETFSQKSSRMAAQVARDNAYDTIVAAEQNLKFATIVAPFNGIITEANPAYPGVNVTPASAVYSIVNPETLFFNAEVNEIDVAKIKVGQKVKLTLDAYPGRNFESMIERIDFAPIITSTGGTAYKVKIFLPKDKDLNLRMGMNGDAEIITASTGDVLFVPSEALIETEDGNFVWVVGSDKKARKTKVETGASSVDSIEIKSGLKEGDLVIIRPPAKLKDGQKVRV